MRDSLYMNQLNGEFFFAITVDLKSWQKYYHPFILRPRFFQFLEIWFEKSVSRNMVRKRWFYTVNPPFFWFEKSGWPEKKDWVCRTTFLKPLFYTFLSSGCRINGPWPGPNPPGCRPYVMDDPTVVVLVGVLTLSSFLLDSCCSCKLNATMASIISIDGLASQKTDHGPRTPDKGFFNIQAFLDFRCFDFRDFRFTPVYNFLSFFPPFEYY